MDKKMTRNLLYISVVIFIFSLTGCGGGGGTLSIGDSNPTEVITESTLVVQHMNNGTDYFNSGNYSNAVFEYQQALLSASTTTETNKAYEALGWALVKNGSPAGKLTINTGEVNVISTFESITDTKLYDATNQDINDARVGLAFAYISRNSSGDIEKAKQLLEKIDPITTNPASPTFNQYFAYIPKLNNGMTNGMVHALISYTYFLTGNIEYAKNQIEYAYKREPANNFIKELRANLTLLGLFN